MWLGPPFNQSKMHALARARGASAAAVGGVNQRATSEPKTALVPTRRSARRLKKGAAMLTFSG
jgi:hypothetical protein